MDSFQDGYKEAPDQAEAEEAGVEGRKEVRSGTNTVLLPFDPLRLSCNLS